MKALSFAKSQLLPGNHHPLGYLLWATTSVCQTFILKTKIPTTQLQLNFSRLFGKPRNRYQNCRCSNSQNEWKIDHLKSSQLIWNRLRLRTLRAFGTTTSGSEALKGCLGSCRSRCTGSQRWVPCACCMAGRSSSTGSLRKKKVFWYSTMPGANVGNICGKMWGKSGNIRSYDESLYFEICGVVFYSNSLGVRVPDKALVPMNKLLICETIWTKGLDVGSAIKNVRLRGWKWGTISDQEISNQKSTRYLLGEYVPHCFPIFDPVRPPKPFFKQTSLAASGPFITAPASWPGKASVLKIMTQAAGSASNGTWQFLFFQNNRCYNDGYIMLLGIYQKICWIFLVVHFSDLQTNPEKPTGSTRFRLWSHTLDNCLPCGWWVVDIENASHGNLEIILFILQFSGFGQDHENRLKRKTLRNKMCMHDKQAKYEKIYLAWTWSVYLIWMMVINGRFIKHTSYIILYESPCTGGLEPWQLGRCSFHIFRWQL